jgi:predicted Zn-dependent protease
VTLALRIALVAALGACALWLADGLGPARDQAAAIELTTGAERPPSAVEVARAERLLARAAGETRSQEPDVQRAQLLLFAGRTAPAVRLLTAVVRREPRNYEAWDTLARAAERADPALAARARERYAALSPPVPPAR